MVAEALAIYVRWSDHLPSFLQAFPYLEGIVSCYAEVALEQVTETRYATLR